MILELFRQEWLKLFSRPLWYGLLAIAPAVQVLRMLAMHFSAPETTLDVVSAPTLWAEGMAWGLRLVAYLVLVLGALGFSEEFTQGTVKTMLTLPLTRRMWFAGKLVTQIVLAAAMVLLCALVGLLLTLAMAGWPDVVREGLLIVSAGEAFAQMLGAVGLTMLLSLPLCAFALWVGLHVTSSGVAVAVAILAATILELATGLFGMGRYLFLAHFHAPVAIVSRLGQGFPVRWEPVFTWGLGVGLLTFVVFAGWGVWRLERMDIDR